KFNSDKFHTITTALDSIASTFDDPQQTIIHDYLNSLITQKIYSATSKRLALLSTKLTRKALRSLRSMTPARKKQPIQADLPPLRITDFSEDIFQDYLTDPIIPGSPFVSDSLFARALSTKIPDPSIQNQGLSDQLTCKDWLRKCHIYVPTKYDGSSVTPSLYLSQNPKAPDQLRKNFYGTDATEQTTNMRKFDIAMSPNLSDLLSQSEKLATSLSEQQTNLITHSLAVVTPSTYYSGKSASSSVRTSSLVTPVPYYSSEEKRHSDKSAASSAPRRPDSEPSFSPTRKLWPPISSGANNQSPSSKTVASLPSSFGSKSSGASTGSLYSKKQVRRYGSGK
ncbi:hypothetical protein HOH45_07000, partial [bacterium]|nr:hypothetical protein [bacterium]